MTNAVPHISVCICTFRRPALLQQLLQRLPDQKTGSLFTYSVVVADNDASRSAEPVVSGFRETSSVPVTYCVEAQQNIALARNKVVENAQGEWVAFIDDDELPADDWLLRLFETVLRYDVAGVLGPVKPRFECPPADWMIKGRFFERPSYPTGHKLRWSDTRTGNVLFRKSILHPHEPPFRAQFETMAEDLDFFRRMMEKGCSFVWCDDAVVFEVVPASRCNRTYLLKRALLRGSNYRKHPSNHFGGAVTSLIAVPCYAVALPFLALFGQHLFLDYAIKLCDHSSRLLALMGWPLITNRNSLA
jgi:glycosyltransferase involved in cell wall biosynthesis